jgi:SAM-dependent methyltransferase
VPAEFVSDLRCPTCSGTLDLSVDDAICAGKCGTAFPIQAGTPILINEAESIFSISTFTSGADTFFKRKSKTLELLDSVTPALVLQGGTRRRVDNFIARLHAEGVHAPKIRVVGGSIVGAGLEGLVADPSVVLLETDVAWGPRTQLICDGHDLPLADASVDAVIVQAVLEHVVDPQRCVAEIHRTLRPDGLVYAEIPFMHPVHGGAFDFTRYSQGGIRILFRRFVELDSGAASGPGASLAYAATFAMHSFAQTRKIRKVLGRVARFVASPLKHLDLFLLRRRGAADAACAVYFVGRRAETSRPYAEIVKAYEGVM